MVRVGNVLLVAAATEPCAAAAYLLALCLGRSPADVVAGLGSGGAAALKDTVTMAVNETLAPVRARRAEYARDLGYVRRVLRDGNGRAEAIAAATLDEVRAAMGMRY